MRHLVAVIPHRDPKMFQNFFALNEEEFDLGLKLITLAQTKLKSKLALTRPKLTPTQPKIGQNSETNLFGLHQ